MQEVSGKMEKLVACETKTHYGIFFQMIFLVGKKFAMLAWIIFNTTEIRCFK